MINLTMEAMMNMKRAVKGVIGEVRREAQDLGRAAHLRERYRVGTADKIRLSRRRQDLRRTLAVLDELMAEREIER